MNLDPRTMRLCRDHSDIDSGVKTDPTTCPACLERTAQLGPLPPARPVNLAEAVNMRTIYQPRKGR